MPLQTLVSALAVALAVAVLSVPALATPGELAPPATHSSLDPVRLAADFAPSTPAVPRVVSFELAADSTTSPADSRAPADSLPAFDSMPAGPVLAAAPVEQPSIIGPVVGALVGGAVGLFGGGGLSYALFGGDDNSGDEYAGAAAAILGATFGEVLLMPAGAHYGNSSRGSYGDALGGSALGFVATLGLSYLGPVGTVAGVLLQTALTVSGERRSAKRRAAEEAAGASATP